VSTERFEIEATEGAADAWRITLRVPASSRFFEGHFEGMPMLPGVAEIVAIAHREAVRVLGPLGRPIRMSRVKFQETIVPLDTLRLGLEREHGQGENGQRHTTVRFRIERVVGGAARIAGSGTLTYAEE
jgi:3-hydroxymyristoyl/3-hydroxydecanoyl-(acyl carrier protein) dehydratase